MAGDNTKKKEDMLTCDSVGEIGNPALTDIYTISI